MQKNSILIHVSKRSYSFVYLTLHKYDQNEHSDLNLWLQLWNHFRLYGVFTRDSFLVKIGNYVIDHLHNKCFGGLKAHIFLNYEYFFISN